MENKNLKNLLTILGIIVVLNFAGHFFFKRFDLTADKRYTLSQTSLNIIKEVKEPLYVDVFLEGNFPGEFKKLQTETQQLLEDILNHLNLLYSTVLPLLNQITVFPGLPTVPSPTNIGLISPLISDLEALRGKIKNIKSNNVYLK